jgi:adenosylcobinamide-GDP ribazoletransferase
LHEDGLADFADGTGGGRNPERVLAIMKDSRIGAYGVLALVLLIGLKVAALAALPPAYALSVLIAAHGISRAGLYATVKALNYARDPADAKVAPIGRAVRRSEWMRTAFFAALALLPVVVMAGSVPWRLPGLAFALLAAIGMAAWIVARMKARVGGWTGDTLGAQQQVTETAFITGASAWISI